MTLFATFLIAAIVLAITPGPGIAYVVARTAAGGRAEGLASCLGTGLGGLVHVLAAALGVSMLVAQSAVAFDVVKYLGAAYLVFLGLRLLWQNRAGSAPAPTPDEPEAAASTRTGTSRAFVEGIFVEVLNVKTALFFLAFLPQFVDLQAPVAAQLGLLGCICVALNTVVDVLAVFAADRLINSGLSRAGKARWMGRVSGVTMLMLGGYLALFKRG